MLKYYAGFKNGQVVSLTITNHAGQVEMPCIYTNKKQAQQALKNNPYFDEIRTVKIIEVKQ